MIDSSVVLEKLKLLLPLAQQMEPAAQLLCEQAAQAISGRLAQPEFGQDTRATFAAAALAGSWLTQCRAADETRQVSFRAGDVSITQPQKSEGKNSLALLLEDAMQQAAPLLKDDSFAFWQIGVI